MFHVKHFIFFYNQIIKKSFQTCPLLHILSTQKAAQLTARLFARGLDKEMGMSGTDAFASNWKVILGGLV